MARATSAADTMNMCRGNRASGARGRAELLFEHFAVLAPIEPEQIFFALILSFRAFFVPALLLCLVAAAAGANQTLIQD